MAKSPGYILYEGPSLLDGAPIVVIATGFNGSHNSKTGNMIQTYILRSDMFPVEAVRAGRDSSICGQCPHRGAAGDGSGRTCYVVLGQGPTVVYKTYKAGRYSRDVPAGAFTGRMVRLGAYGDPAAAPVRVWHSITQGAIAWTGYTHQWRTAPELRPYCMASVDSVEEAAAATRSGWRTFRVALPGAEERLLNEAVCPASAEAGRKLTCIECGACSGTTTGRRGSIVIQAHGGTAVMANVARMVAA